MSPVNFFTLLIFGSFLFIQTSLAQNNSSNIYMIPKIELNKINHSTSLQEAPLIEDSENYYHVQEFPTKTDRSIASKEEDKKKPETNKKEKNSKSQKRTPSSDTMETNKIQYWKYSKD